VPRGNAMKKVAVIGGGFAGIAALRYLSRYKKVCDVTLFDAKEDFEFLPLLPDILSGSVLSEDIQAPLCAIAGKCGASFVREKVAGVDAEAGTVKTSQREETFDYIIVAVGSLPQFYGNAAAEQYGKTLNSVKNAVAIREGIIREEVETVVVCGGGYTGVEAMTHIWKLLHREKMKRRLVIVNKGATLVPTLPGWVQRYVEKQVQVLGIEVKNNAKVVSGDEKTVVCSDGSEYNNAFLVWTAGVQVPSLLQGEVDATSQGRIKVDAHMRAAARCYIVGDMAAVYDERKQLVRMGAQFSVPQGKCAARNIVRDIIGRAPVVYTARDLGYIIPMAHNKSCGEVLGVPIRGRMATALHYIMSVIRFPDLKARLRLIRGLKVT
jgi:NADH:ubiquinone reductase (H+-translocating)